MKRKNNTKNNSLFSGRRKKHAKKKAFLLSLSLVAAALLFAGVFTGIGVSAAKGEYIYPNVTVAGVAIGNMTVEQAAKELEGAARDNLEDKVVAAKLADDVTLKITGEQAGLVAITETAASLAYEYGREGDLLTNAFTYLRCRFGKTKLNSIVLLKADEKMVREAIKADRERLNKERMVSSTYEVTPDAVVIHKGKPGVAFDEQKLTETICQAFEKGRDTVTYDADMIDPEQVNWDEIAQAAFSQPENAVYDQKNRRITDHVDGIGFDSKEAQELLDAAEYGAAVSIPLTSMPPEVTKEDLEKQLFPDMLATSTTDLADEPNEVTDDSLRTMNVELAANTINGTILEPGERFEFNKVVGKRTAERGYHPSDAYAGTEIVTQLGGGICQVSSTMYHALLHTDVQINKRRNHTLTVAYLPLGMDATVSWGNPEFSFTNNTGHPMKIEMTRDGDMLTATFYGTKTSDIKIEPRAVSISSTPYSTKYKDDPSLPAKETRVEREGGDGQVVDVYKDYKDADGNLIQSVYIGRDTYKPTTSVVRRGTGPAQ